MNAKPKSYIYFLRNPNTGLVKIGTSANLHARIRDLSSEHAAPLELIGYIEGGEPEEIALHLEFKHHAFQREWFHPHQEIIDYATSRTLPLNEVKPIIHDAASQSPEWQALIIVLREIGTQEIVRVTGCTKRTAENWQSGFSIPSADYFATLMALSDEFADAVVRVTGRYKGGLTFVQKRKLLEVLGEK